MTTIAYRNGVLAGDGRVTSGDSILTDNDRKVFRFSDGRLFAYSGSVEAGDKLRIAVQRHCEIPELVNSNEELEVDAILVMPDGKFFNLDGRLWVRERVPYVAIGSGHTFAYGAMDAGASAVEAVRIACKRHTHTGGRVRVVRLHAKVGK